MPELPEVVGLKKYLDSTSLHQKIERIRVHDDRLMEHTTARQLARRLKGAKLETSTRHGKYLFAQIITNVHEIIVPHTLPRIGEFTDEVQH